MYVLWCEKKQERKKSERWKGGARDNGREEARDEGLSIIDRSGTHTHRHTHTHTHIYGRHT